MVRPFHKRAQRMIGAEHGLDVIECRDASTDEMTFRHWSIPNGERDSGERLRAGSIARAEKARGHERRDNGPFEARG